jgi:hypothetical protein
MRSRLVRILALACLSVALLALSAPRVAGEEAPDPAQLVKALETGDFEQREDAVKKLEALGEAARPALQKAFAESEVLEVRLELDPADAAIQQALNLVGQVVHVRVQAAEGDEPRLAQAGQPGVDGSHLRGLRRDGEHDGPLDAELVHVAQQALRGRAGHRLRPIPRGERRHRPVDDRLREDMGVSVDDHRARLFGEERSSASRGERRTTDHRPQTNG